MSPFGAYLELGFDHISDLQGYDHMLFIITLCAVYKLTEWKKILVLVTAFTIGHSVTLAMSALNIVRINADLIELLIPITILLTAIFNVSQKEKENQPTFSRAVNGNYLLALCFGFIHGMGFSNYFRALLGELESIVLPLFAFNIGLELGQILIVIVFFAIYWVLDRIFNIKHREWNVFISGAGGGVAAIMILENLLG